MPKVAPPSCLRRQWASSRCATSCQRSRCQGRGKGCIRLVSSVHKIESRPSVGPHSCWRPASSRCATSFQRWRCQGRGNGRRRSDRTHAGGRPGHLHFVRHFASDRGAKFEAKYAQDGAALIYAAGSGHLVVVRGFASIRGAEIEATSAEGCPRLWLRPAMAILKLCDVSLTISVPTSRQWMPMVAPHSCLRSHWASSRCATSCRRLWCLEHGRENAVIEPSGLRGGMRARFDAG
jgi:hypothetical protein